MIYKYKRKDNSLRDHKPQRSRICLPSPIRSNDQELVSVGEPDGYTSAASLAPNSEYSKLQLSPLHPPDIEFNLSCNHDRDFMQDWFSDMVNGSGYGTRFGDIPFLMKVLFRLVRGWPQTHPSCYDTTETHFTSNPEEGFQRFRLIHTSDIYFNPSSYFDKFWE